MSFPRYPKYKDSGVEWLGEVPEHWEALKVKQALASMGSGGTPDTEAPEYWADHSGIPWVAIGDMSDRDHVEATARFLTEEGLKSRHIPVWPAGTLLFSMYASLGHVAELRVPAATNQAILALVPNATSSQSFLKRWFEYLRPRLREHASSNTQDNLNAEKVRNLPVVRPPMHEQHAIAAFLDHETASIDGLIAEQERLVELLREKRQAVISHAVTKGLDQTVPMKDSGVEWLGNVPAHWDVRRIKHQITSIEQGWSPQCESYPAEADSEWGVLKVGCVNGGRFDPSENKLLPQDLEPIPTLAIERGDLLISRANTRQLVGSAAVAERSYPRLMLCDKLYRLRVDSRNCTPDFICYYLGSSGVRGRIDIEATGASSSMLNIGQSAILELDIAVPPVDEQRTILAHVAAETARLEALVTEAQRAIDLLHERRAALISAAVTGKIDVRNHQTPEQHHVGG